LINEVLHEDNIRNLVKKFPMLDLLEDIKNINDVCDYSFVETECNGRKLNEIQVLFLGKTGYGKSTLLNKIIGENVFKTDDVECCTKQVQSSIFSLPIGGDFYFSLYDFPGIGESKSADKRYLDKYLKMVATSSVIIYLLRADQRDFSIDEEVIKLLSKTAKVKKKIIIALNCVDKIEPVNKKNFFNLSAQQKSNIDSKKKFISKKFDVSENYIVELSASDSFNIDQLVDKIGVSIIKTHWQLMSDNFKKEEALMRGELAEVFNNFNELQDDLFLLLNKIK